MKTRVVSNICSKGRCTFLLAVCLMLASCQMTQTRVSTESRQVDPNDPCQQIRSQLVGTQDHFSTNIASGAVIGAIAGLLTSIQSGDRKKILTHTIVGGVAGAAAGYLKGKIQEAENRDDLRRAINSDVQRDTRKVTEMGTILGRLNECRRIQVAAIKRRFDDGRSTAEQTRGELKTVRAGIRRDNTLIAEILGEVTERKGVYVASIGQVEERTEAEVLGNVAEYTPETVPQSAITTRHFAQTGSNVRAGPAADASVLGVLPAGAPVDVVGPAANGDWYEVRYEDRQAYVFAELLETSAPTTVAAGPSTIDASTRPTPENDVQKLELASREVSAVYEADSADLFRDIEELEELTLM